MVIKEVFYELILNAFKEVEKYDEVLGATEINYGYYLMHNFNLAKWYAKDFSKYLIKNKDNNLIFEYPKTERLIINDGNNFYDS